MNEWVENYINISTDMSILPFIETGDWRETHSFTWVILLFNKDSSLHRNTEKFVSWFHHYINVLSNRNTTAISVCSIESKVQTIGIWMTLLWNHCRKCLKFFIVPSHLKFKFIGKESILILKWNYQYYFTCCERATPLFPAKNASFGLAFLNSCLDNGVFRLIILCLDCGNIITLATNYHSHVLSHWWDCWQVYSCVSCAVDLDLLHALISYHFITCRVVCRCPSP